jgi:hypothetical protein
MLRVITLWPFPGPLSITHVSNVLVDRHSGPMLGEDSSPPRVRLTEEGVSKPSSGESEVESADAGEEGADCRSNVAGALPSLGESVFVTSASSHLSQSSEV